MDDLDNQRMDPYLEKHTWSSICETLFNGFPLW